MALVHKQYHIFPKVVPAFEPSRIEILPRGKFAAFFPDEEVTVTVLPMEETDEPQNLGYPTQVVVAKEGRICFDFAFEGEQQHLIRIFRTAQNVPRHLKKIQLSVYSVLPDLYARRPYRGDLHVHSTHSDGLQSVEVVVAAARKEGFDFLGLTDHHRYHPSQEAIAYYQNLPGGVALFHGEEIHLPGNHTHIVNFGGSASINELVERDPEEYARQVNALADALPDLPKGVDAFEYAACLWTFERIRECGGLGIFPHPHWIANVYHVRDQMTWHLFRTKPFDAFELLGGQTVHENNMQLAIYHEARAQGLSIPIVGSTDTHDTQTDSGYYGYQSTLVFSQSLDREDLFAAVRDLFSVAVEKYPGEAVRAHGPYRMVKYALFLLNEFYPVHDELCALEGTLFQLHIDGDPDARQMLEIAQNKVSEYTQKSFGRANP